MNVVTKQLLKRWWFNFFISDLTTIHTTQYFSKYFPKLYYSFSSYVIPWMNLKCVQNILEAMCFPIHCVVSNLLPCISHKEVKYICYSPTIKFVFSQQLGLVRWAFGNPSSPCTWLKISQLTARAIHTSSTQQCKSNFSCWSIIKYTELDPITKSNLWNFKSILRWSIPSKHFFPLSLSLLQSQSNWRYLIQKWYGRVLTADVTYQGSFL